jgi:hypothetical protein
MPIIVLDPVQQPLAADAGEGLPQAPRLDMLNGKTLGLWTRERQG